MSNSRKKSLFINTQSIAGIIMLFVLIFLTLYFLIFYSFSSSTEFNALPDFNIKKNFAGTDVGGNNLLIFAFKAFSSQSVLIFASWLFAILLSLPLSYVFSRKNLLGAIFAELTSFAPSFILFFILSAFIRNSDLLVVILIAGLSFLPYSVIKLSKGFGAKDRALVLYYSLNVLLSVSLFVQLAGFCSLLPKGVLSLGGNIKSSLSYAFNFPHLVLPYFILHFLLLSAIGLLIRGVKNAYLFNIMEKALPALDKKEKTVLKDDKKKEEESDLENLQTVENTNADTSLEKDIPGEEHVLPREINVYEVASKLSICNSIEELESYITELLVYELEYHSASFYKVLENGYSIQSIHNKTIPVEMIDLEKENKEFLSKAFKFDFLNTLKDKSLSHFLYPGKENYDRIFHHLIIDGKVGYILEVSYNNKLRSEGVELDRLRKFIPECEWEIWRHTSSGYKAAVGQSPEEEAVSSQLISAASVSEASEEILPEIIAEEEAKGSDAAPVIVSDEEKTADEVFLEIDEKKAETEEETLLPEDTPDKIAFKEEQVSPKPKSEMTVKFLHQDFASRYDILLQKGFDYIKENDYNLALASLKEALLINSFSHEALIGIGHVYFEKGLYEEALANYIDALKINAYSPVAYKYIGNIYLLKKDYKMAYSAYSKLLGLDPKDNEIKAKLSEIEKKF